MGFPDLQALLSRSDGKIEARGVIAWLEAMIGMSILIESDGLLMARAFLSAVNSDPRMMDIMRNNLLMFLARRGTIDPRKVDLEDIAYSDDLVKSVKFDWVPPANSLWVRTKAHHERPLAHNFHFRCERRVKKALATDLFLNVVLLCDGYYACARSVAAIRRSRQRGLKARYRCG
jgi:hypothetical protein